MTGSGVGGWFVTPHQAETVTVAVRAPTATAAF